MEKPKVIRVIEHKGKLFREGDIVNFAIEGGLINHKRHGRIIAINKNETLKFDCSKQCESEIRLISIEDLVSISHAAEQED